MRNKTILLIDDDPDDQLIFTDALSEINNEVNCFVASNGQDALVCLQQIPEPLLIFLDLNMPVMNGFEFLTRIKQSHQHKEIPVVIYTTSDHPRDKSETLAGGAYMFFTKTADFKTLKVKLQEILSDLTAG